MDLVRSMQLCELNRTKALLNRCLTVAYSYITFKCPFQDMIQAMDTVTSTPPYPLSFHKSKLFMPSLALSHHAPCAINVPLSFVLGSWRGGEDVDVPVDVVGRACNKVQVMNHLTCGWVSLREFRRLTYSLGGLSIEWGYDDLFTPFSDFFVLICWIWPTL